MNNYSVLNTKIKLFEYKGRNCIKKTFKPNLDLQISNDLLNTFFLKYINNIQSASISFPEIQKHEIHDNKIIYYCEYKGENVLQRFSYDDFLSNKVDVYFSGIINIIKKAQKNNLLIDPHPKNFTLSNQKIYYVDFCPPLINEYISHRIEIENNFVDIIKDNFNYFKPENLVYHFCGDFIDAFRDKNIEPLYKKFYKHFISNKIIDNQEFSTFITKCKDIRKLEDKRIDKGIYLF